MSTKLWIELILRWYKYFISNSCAYSQVANKRPAEGHRAVHRQSSYGSANSGGMGKGQMSPFSLKTLNWIKSLIVTLKSTLKGKLLFSQECQGIYSRFPANKTFWDLGTNMCFFCKIAQFQPRRIQAYSADAHWGIQGTELHFWNPWNRYMVTIVMQIFFVPYNKIYILR